MNPEKLPAALAAGKEAGIDVVGIIGVGLFGQPANYAEIKTFANDHGLWLVDDAAQSFGATLNDQPVGQLADVTCTSFFPAKPLGAYGDGGAVFTNNTKVAEIIRSCRVHGMGQNKYENVRIGMTGRLDSMQAVVLDAKLDIFADELVLRQQAADRYAALLEHLVDVPVLSSGATSSWAQYVIKLPRGTDREGLIQKNGDSRSPNCNLLPSSNAQTATLCKIPSKRMQFACDNGPLRPGSCPADASLS